MITLLESAEKGCGLYSFGEVAHYLGIHQATLRSWFYPSGKREPLIQADVVKTEDDGAWLNFHDFLQAFAVKTLKDGGVKPKDVREAIVEAKEKYGLPYPLSMRGHTIYADQNGRVHILTPESANPVELTGGGKGQINFAEIIQSYIKRLEFDEHGMAQRFIVFEKKFDGVLRRVIMEPHTNFGEPTVEGTAYRASTLRDAAQAEGNPGMAAEIYGVDKSAVMVAMEPWDDGFRVAA